MASKKRNSINILFDKLRKKNPKAKVIVFTNKELKTVTQDTQFMNQFDATKFDSSDLLPERLKENGFFIVHFGKGKHAFVKGDNIKIVTTDGLQGYPRVLRKAFGLHKIEGKSKIIHNVVIADERGFNHKIERLHNTIRDRTKIMRGFHGSLESAKAIMKGMEIYYNFVRKHQGIENKTPSEEAIPELNLSTNKWLSLIKLSKT